MNQTNKYGSMSTITETRFKKLGERGKSCQGKHKN